LLVAAALAIVTVGCSKGSDTTAPSGTTQPAPTTAPAGPAAPIATECKVETLTPVVQAKNPGGALGELICDGPFAAATVRGGEGLPPAGVALFRVKGNSYELLVTADAEAPKESFVPADFSVTTYSAWKSKYNAVAHPAAPTTKASVKPGAPSVTVNTNTTLGQNCSGEGPDQVCEAATTTVPATTPDGQTVPPVTSQFCRFNYADPRCKQDPQFPG
jgi:hypothetical protein